MTTPTSPMAAVKLLRKALEECKHEAMGCFAVNVVADEALRLTDLIEQPTSEAVAWRIAYAPGAQLPAFSMGDPYFTEVKPLDNTVFSAGTVITPLYSVPPANSTDAQKLATLREGLHELGWCAEFGALAKKILDGTVEVEGARSFCAGRPEDMPKYVQPEPLQWEEDGDFGRSAVSSPAYKAEQRAKNVKARELLDVVAGAPVDERFGGYSDSKSHAGNGFGGGSGQYRIEPIGGGGGSSESGSGGSSDPNVRGGGSGNWKKP